MKEKISRRYSCKYAAIAGLIAVGLAFAGCQLTDDSKPATSVEETAVGVYDSRLIALAYWQEKVDGKERFGSSHESMGITPMELGVLMAQQVFSYHEPVQAL